MAVVFLASQLQASPVAADTDAAVFWGPYVTGATDISAIVHWKPEVPGPGILEYRAAESPEETGYCWYEGPADYHHVSLTGLLPDTEYRYRIWEPDESIDQTNGPLQTTGSFTGWLDDHARLVAEGTFRTLGADRYTFIVYGDTQEQVPWFTQLERHKLVADRIAGEDDVAFVVHLGDFVEEPVETDEWNRCFEAARSLFATTAIVTVMGNHETDMSIYQKMFGYDDYYSFDAGPVHLTVLDTNTWADIDAQSSWLDDDLSRAEDWKLVFYHHPSYTSQERNYGGWEHSRNAWEDIFLENGVNAVFSGHVHAYERYEYNGLTYITTGTGGDTLVTLEEEKPAGFQTALEHELGYTRVTVSPEHITLEYITVAKVAEDNRSILEVYPPDRIFETVMLEPSNPAGPAPEDIFTVTPASLELAMSGDGTASFTLSVLTDTPGEVRLGTEDLPLTIKPEQLSLNGSDEPQRITLEAHINGGDNGDVYQGKLTLLKYMSENVAVGIKVPLTVTLLAGQPGGILETLKDNYILLVIAVIVLAVLLWLMRVYRQYRR